MKNYLSLFLALLIFLPYSHSAEWDVLYSQQNAAGLFAEKKLVPTGGIEYLCFNASKQMVLKTVVNLKTDLGLGAAAYQDTTAFEPAGAVSTFRTALTEVGSFIHVDSARNADYATTAGNATKADTFTIGGGISTALQAKANAAKTFAGYGITGVQTLDSTLILPVLHIKRDPMSGNPYINFRYLGDLQSWSIGQDILTAKSNYFTMSYYNGIDWMRWLDVSPTGAAQFYGSLGVQALAGDSMFNVIPRTTNDWVGITLKNAAGNRKLELFYNQTIGGASGYGSPAGTPVINAADGELVISTGDQKRWTFGNSTHSSTVPIELPAGAGATATQALRRDVANGLYATVAEEYKLTGNITKSSVVNDYTIDTGLGFNAVAGTVYRISIFASFTLTAGAGVTVGGLTVEPMRNLSPEGVHSIGATTVSSRVAGVSIPITTPAGSTITPYYSTYFIFAPSASGYVGMSWWANSGEAGTSITLTQYRMMVEKLK